MIGSLLFAVSAGDKHNLSIFDPVSPPAHSIRDLSILVYAIIGLIFVLVEGILIYSVIRFRHRGESSATEPPQVYGSKPIEIAWTAAPGLVVFILVLVITRTLWEVNRTLPEPTDEKAKNSLFVRVVGKQWWWEYHYQHYEGKELGFITANELHIPQSGVNNIDRPVYLRLESADVCHSYWVPRLAGKTDLIPGRVNTMWFQTNVVDEMDGWFLGQCAEYCGTQHANMLLRVKVDPPDQFEKWLKNEQGKAHDSNDDDVIQGKKIFLRESCVNCHRVWGHTQPGDGGYAPDLTHLMSRKTLASGMIDNDEKNLRDWIRDPQKIKKGSLMPAFGLSDGDLDKVVKYLRSLK